MSLCTRLGALLAAAPLVASTAFAAPPEVRSVNDNDDDATIYLSIYNQVITDNSNDNYDERSWCSVRIVDNGGGDDFSNGDRIEVEVRESDAPAGHDVIWATSFNVSSAEVSANRVDRTFDCSNNFEYDGFGDNLEVYAWAKVEKDDTCFTCRYDRPETSNVDVSTRADDSREDNDAVGAGTAVAVGRTDDFIAKDDDYLTFTNPGVNRIQLDVLHNPAGGVLDAAAYTADGTLLVSNVVLADDPRLSTDNANPDDRTTLVLEVAGAGPVVFKVFPVAPNDPNFYNIDISLTPVETECSPGETELVPCGNCGGQERVCDNLGNWTAASGECLNEGECAQGETQTEDCGAGAEHTRTCSNACEWEEWDECVGTSCSPGETVTCYSGPAGTQGVGACTAGERTCVDGVFSDCVGEVVPAVEECGDGIDGDCDNDEDRYDDDCDSGLARLGEPCSADGDCDPRWTCLGDPDPDRFIDGYCGDDQACSGAANECTADGICADLGDSDYCLLACGDGVGCRFGYTCANLPEGDACIPRCRDDDDCFFSDLPECNVGNGICQPIGGFLDTDDTDVTAEIRSCGCATGTAPGALGLGLIGLLGLALRRRR